MDIDTAFEIGLVTGMTAGILVMLLATIIYEALIRGLDRYIEERKRR